MGRSPLSVCWLLLLALWIRSTVLDIALAQDLQFECISCADKFDKCELDCSFNLQDYNVTEVSTCQANCLAAKDTCEDDTPTLKCTACTMVCAETYDTEMRSCLSEVTRSSKMTYGSSQSECAIYASFDMDTCMALCSPQNGPAQVDDWNR